MQSSGDQKSGHDDDDGNGNGDDDAAINYGMNSQRKKKLTISNNNNPTSHSRRDFLLQNVAISSILLGTLSSKPSEASSSTRSMMITDIFPSLTLSNNSSSSSSSSSDNNEIIDPIDIQKVLQQNKINVTITNNKSQSQIYINQTSLDKMSVPIPPLSSSSPSSSYSPSFKNKALPLSSWLKQNVNYQLKQRQYPYPQTVERIPDSKLFIASVIAGSFTEVIRSVVLYPITTIKSRVQYHPPMRLSFIDKLKSFDLRRIGSIDKRGSAGNLSQEEEEKKSVLIVLDDNVGVEVQDHQTHSMIDHGNVVVAVDDDDDDDKYQKNNATLSLQDITYNSTSARNINETKLILTPPPLLQQDQPKRLMTNLYAGILPQLIATVPACGIFFAVKDITKRELIKAIESSSSSSSSSFSYIASIDDLTLTLFSVFLGDVFSLAIKTPALTLSTRAQVETMIDDDIDLNMGESLDCNSTTTSKPTGTRRTTMDVFQDSWKKLPIVILTDLPYLFLKIVLVRSLATGQENIAEYALLNTAVSCICAGITTPFDVVRTRVLVDSNGDPSDGLDGGLINSDDEGYRKRGGNLKNIIYTMKLVMNETDANNDFALQEEDDIDNSSCELQEGGGTALEKNKQYFNAQNLFAGWYERVLYLGLSVAWFDSLRILSYVGIRDFVLLKIFH